MDESTDGVTLLTGFVFDVLGEYEDTRRLCEPAFAMASKLDPNRLDDWCSIEIYNNICDWIEENVGGASIRRAGVAIGARAFANIVKEGKIEEPTPRAMMDALAWAASVMIRDPKARGWEIVDGTATSIRMRRTQTFNCLLQEGLLLSLIEKTGVLMPSVSHVKCTRRGDDYCEYDLKWLKPTRSTNPKELAGS